MSRERRDWRLGGPVDSGKTQGPLFLFAIVVNQDLTRVNGSILQAEHNSRDRGESTGDDHH